MPVDDAASPQTPSRYVYYSNPTSPAEDWCEANADQVEGRLDTHAGTHDHATGRGNVATSHRMGGTRSSGGIEDVGGSWGDGHAVGHQAKPAKASGEAKAKRRYFNHDHRPRTITYLQLTHAATTATIPEESQAYTERTAVPRAIILEDAYESKDVGHT